ncbi:MAG: DNA photolyase family protein [Anaerolineae bacterium]|jgi:deoxyribodipyrimidine photo-lyase|nr:DNA photolyase family protein [Anaerolineae bacterium]
MAPTIWWARRDLRLHDNFALREALASGDPVVPVFVLDPALLAWRDAGAKRVAFMLAGLAALDADLRARGSRLIVRLGNPAEELARLREETDATGVFAEADPWPYAQERDARVGQRVPLTLTPGITAKPYDAILKPDGGPYTVYTPFSRAWKARGLPAPSELIPAPDRLAPPPDVQSVPIPGQPGLPPTVPFAAGEAEGLRRLRAFAGGAGAPVYAYDETRNRMDLDGTSQLSPYLRWGMVSALRAAVAAVHALQNAPDAGAKKSAETWLNELIWREFYQAALFRFPLVLEQEFQERMRGIAWRNDPAELAAWQEGRTGYPVVDAAMRQLVTTGWMHNRARLIVASFLVKDLLIDWRLGERFFMQHLLDGDPAANNGGWQWTAGVGTDAAPYFRVFNPALQAEKFDPDGAYVRRWVPELAKVPAKHIHSPHLMPAQEQERAGAIIGADYPAPIVDHAAARERVLAAFKLT